MKVLLVSDQPVKRIGDTIYGASHFSDNLERLSSLGEIHLCVPHVTKTQESCLIFDNCLTDYIATENVTFIRKSQVFPSVAVRKILRDKIDEVDLVIAYVPSLNAEIAACLSHKSEKPYLAIMIACVWDGLWNKDWKRKFAACYRYLSNRMVMRKADYTLYVTGRFLQRRYPSSSRISAGISDVVLQPIRESVLQQRLKRIGDMEIDGIIHIATTAALNISYKGQRFVIRALKRLKDIGYDNYRYYLIGGGDEMKLRNLSERLGVEDQVVFVGKVSHPEVFRMLEEMDVYLHPSLQEGLPRSVVEAMSLGLPCIGAKTGGIPELLEGKMLVRRKNVGDIVARLLELRDKNLMMEQACRNVETAGMYECVALDDRRRRYYDSILDDLKRSGNNP